ncbi:ImmA/IrrE family metallo-endopeptidase [Actinomyces capricornis]|uniref:IrrE N-terminal-like domain-containing protein n=1 Tax=Actinomyces capricornis TaxID=2755559 RepID=A0ABM7U9U7_9ACTO|nr:ImmA/IrrE family metallo-endopeptidase [Actinomyces capricornis]BDA64137.1 hypothetical protein MANAM107_09710 [Actinomyces capricornis]
MQSLGEAIGRVRGMRVVLTPIPEELQSAEVNGLTVSVGSTAKVYYDPRLSPLNRTQTILHEFAHILHGDLCSEKSATSYRTTFETPQERRAELTAMRLMFELHRRCHSSDLLDFLSGRADDSPRY